MRKLLAVMIASTFAVPAVADRERREPAPCTCIRKAPLRYDVLGRDGTKIELQKADEFARHTITNLDHSSNRAIDQCLRAAGDDPEATLELTFEAGSSKPRVKTTGPKAVVACFDKLSFTFFAAPETRKIVRLHVEPYDAAHKRARDKARRARIED